jgi:hypothetical protein
VGTALVTLLVCGALLALYMLSGEPQAAQLAMFGGATDLPPTYRLTARELVDAYQADAAAADRRYRDQALEVTGLVRLAGRGALGGAFVILGVEGRYGARPVVCVLADPGQVHGLAPDQVVTVRAQGGGQQLRAVLLRLCHVSARPIPREPAPAAAAEGAAPAGVRAEAGGAASPPRPRPSPTPGLTATVGFDNGRSVTITDVAILPRRTTTAEPAPVETILFKTRLVRLGVETVTERSVPLSAVQSFAFHERPSEPDEKNRRSFPECTCVVRLRDGSVLNLVSRAATGPTDTQDRQFPPFYSLRAQVAGGSFALQNLLSCPEVKDGAQDRAVISIAFEAASGPPASR